MNSSITVEETVQKTKTTETESVVESYVQKVYHVGDVLEDRRLDGKKLKIVYVASGECVEPKEHIPLHDEYHIIFIKLAFENISPSLGVDVPIFHFECYADGNSCEKYFDYSDYAFQSGFLSANKMTMATIYYEVPDGAQEIQIEYEYPGAIKKEIFAYGGDLDSGYQLEKKTQVSKNVIQSGQWFETEELKICYISSERDTSYPYYILPKEGYHFATYTFEVENISTSDIQLHHFVCFADGVACVDSNFRQDGIIPTLSAGCKTKGTVTFEVPDSASVVEVEYIINYETLKRAIFDALV